MCQTAMTSNGRIKTAGTPGPAVRSFAPLTLTLLLTGP